jgi:hypothetical protein
MNKPFSQQTRDSLSKIKEMEKVHLEYGLKMFSASNGAFYSLDILAIGAIKRSVAHCSAFQMLIRKRNFICAASILRMQLDNALRFYGAFIVENPHDYAKKVLHGISVRKLKDKQGNLMRDHYLVETLAKEYPWITKVYKETSGYIHLSEKHIFNAIDGYNENDRSANIKISESDIDLPDTMYLEAVNAFIASTEIFLRYLTSWIITKDHPDIVEEIKMKRNKSNAG